MEISLSNIIMLALLHFIADFVLQSDEVAKNKSKSNKVLLQHITIYSIPFMIFISPLYGLINGLIHGIVDYITSRWTSKLWAKGDTHNFFVVIGFDQLLHMTTLYVTFVLIV